MRKLILFTQIILLALHGIAQQSSTYKFTTSGHCQKSNVKFTLTNLANINTVSWNFGDPDSNSKNTSIELNPDHTFEKWGNYEVKLTVNLLDGSSEKFSKNIVINNVPRPNFGRGQGYNYFYHYVPSGNTVELDPGEFSSYRWNDNSTNQTLKINVSGNYSVSVTNEYGCNSSIAATVVIQDPKIAFYDIESNSPYNCSDEVPLKAFDYLDAYGHIVPGFTITMRTDDNSLEHNSMNFYQNGGFFVKFPLGEFHQDTIHQIWGEYMDPTTEWSFEWCDIIPDGTFPYVVQDHSKTITTSRGVIDNNDSECVSVTIGHAIGVATFSGPGVTNNRNGTGVFNAAKAGEGTHKIKYCWDNLAGFSGCTTQTIKVIIATANAGNNHEICQGESIVLGGSPTATGGAGDYTYQWTPSTGLNNNKIANPIATPHINTTYTLTVTDNFGNGCAVTDIVKVKVNKNPIAIIPNNELCINSTISVDATSTEGSANIISHFWSGDTNYLSKIDIQKPSFTPETFGTFNLVYTVKDANSCSGSDEAKFTVHNNPNINLGNDTLLCQGNSLLLDFSDNELDFLWNNNSIDKTHTILSTGSYSAIVTDQFGCTNSDEINVEIAPLPIITKLEKTELLCYNKPGQIHLDATSPTATLKYSINNIDFQDNGHFNNLYPGDYQIIVTDLNNCVTISDKVTLSQGNEIIIDNIIAHNIMDCYGSNSGSINILAQGGLPPLSYSIDNGINFKDNGVFENIKSDNYSIIVSDANNCQTSKKSIFIDQPNQLMVASEFSESILCHNDNTGRIFINVSGGTGLIQYALNGGEFQNSRIFEKLPPGNYTISIKDKNGCTFNSPKTHHLTNPPKIIINNELIDSISCNNNANGKITINAIGGTGNLSYQLNNDKFSTNYIFTKLPAALYVVTIKDENGCLLKSNNQHILKNPEALKINSEKAIPIDCYNANNGQIIIDANGGSGQLQYALNGRKYTNKTNLSDLSPGNYSIKIKDANGCIITSDKVHTFNNPNELFIVKDSTINISCNNFNDGKIIIKANGGTGQLTYNLNNTITNKTGTFNLLSNGNYEVFTTDENNCTISSLHTIINPKLLKIISENITDISCNNTQDGSINIDAIGGTGNLSYSLNNNNYQLSNQFNNLSANIYNIWVKDENNCTASTGQPHTLHNPKQLFIISETSKEISCHDFNNAYIKVLASGGSGQIRYSLKEIGKEKILDKNDNGSFVDLSDGKYTVYISDKNGCQLASPTIHKITNPPIIEIYNETIKNITCYGNSDGIIQLRATGGTGRLQYCLTDLENNDTICNYSEVAYFKDLDPYKYIINITDTKNCLLTKEITLTQPDKLVIEVSDVSETCKGYNKGHFEYLINGGTPQYKFKITDNNNLFVLDNTDLPSGLYNLLVIDQNNCKDTATVKILEVDCISMLEIPNIFSPNGDEKNQIFETKNKNLIFFDAVIFNRWGTKLYHWTNPKGGWDGIIQNTNTLAADGVYYYKINATGKDAIIYKKTGFLYLIR